MKGLPLPTWGSKGLERARRRLRRRAEPVAPVVAPTTMPARCRLTVALTGSDRTRLGSALADTLGRDPSAFDTPVRLAEAVASAIERAGGIGRPVVTRSPAALYTPEYWHVRVDEADARARAEIERLVGRGVDG